MKKLIIILIVYSINCNAQKDICSNYVKQIITEQSGIVHFISRAPVHLSIESFLQNKINITFDLSTDRHTLKMIITQVNDIQPAGDAKIHFIYDDDISDNLQIPTPYLKNSWVFTFTSGNKSSIDILQNLVTKNLDKIRLQMSLDSYFTLNIDHRNATQIKQTINCLAAKMVHR